MCLRVFECSGWSRPFLPRSKLKALVFASSKHKVYVLEKVLSFSENCVSMYVYIYTFIISTRF